MNRSTTLPPESSSRWAGQEGLKETFGKEAERHLLHEMGQYLETNLLHPHCVVLSSPQSLAHVTIRSKNLLMFVSAPLRVTGPGPGLLPLLSLLG
jgi:hypothetical protein